ncbi:cytidylyltransferase domain-containing protein [Flavobacterium sp. RSB2_4_14]|uniref:cytidylyltransferase domain-containing protein n=1 Tax=Flavobacterium sp. RSB2_4_14 TaxID=3447665 RepID=UPI003F2C0D4E
MADGLLNKKVAFIIQARMQSTRLPGKILLPLPLGSGKPLLSWIIDEVKKSKHTAEIIIATSVNPENDVLVSFCEQNNVGYFRGEEDDVLSRFTAIAKSGDYDCIVRLTADNPIIDISILDDTITEHFSKANDYTSTAGLPTGMNFEVISTATLLDLENYSLTATDREHVTLFVRSSGKYSLGVFTPAINPLLKTLRLTVDYPSDYALLSSILAQSVLDENQKGIKLVAQTFHLYPWLFETNASNFQKGNYATLAEELAHVKPILEQYEFKKVLSLLDSKTPQN